MTTLAQAVGQVLQARHQTQKPLAIVLAGHNGSGKSTMWRRALADTLRVPLINADRMMLSILPEPGEDGHLIPWAAALTDNSRSPAEAFTACQVQLGRAVLYDVRAGQKPPPGLISGWMELVAPR